MTRQGKTPLAVCSDYIQSIRYTYIRECMFTLVILPVAVRVYIYMTLVGSLPGQRTAEHT